METSQINQLNCPNRYSMKEYWCTRLCFHLTFTSKLRGSFSGSIQQVVLYCLKLYTLKNTNATIAYSTVEKFSTIFTFCQLLIVVNTTGKYCKGLQTVDLSGVTVTTSSLRSFSKQCPKLEVTISFVTERCLYSLVPSHLFGSFGRHDRWRGYLCLIHADFAVRHLEKEVLSNQARSHRIEDTCGRG